VIVGLFLAETCVTGLRPTRRDEDVEEEVGGGKIGPLAHQENLKL
jgi:hypothetical protein